MSGFQTKTFVVEDKIKEKGEFKVTPVRTTEDIRAALRTAEEALMLEAPEKVRPWLVKMRHTAFNYLELQRA